MTKKIHKSAIISPNIRIRSKYFSLGKYSVIDDYSYFSNKKIEILDYTHIGPHCTFGGGRKSIYVGNHVSLSSKVSIYAQSNDFSNDLVSLYANLVSNKTLIEGDVIIGDYCGIGAGAIIMPDNILPQGVSIGANSFVPSNFKFESFTLYLGTPIKPIKKKIKKRIIEQSLQIEKSLNE